MRIRAAAVVVSGVLVSVLTACNSMDEPGVKGTSKLVIPVDDRPAVQALKSPPPISGGTLAISPDDRIAVAADPDRDRVSIIELSSDASSTIALERGDEPGRVVIGTDNRAYVALRGSGVIATLDLTNRTIVARTQVCAAPRGLALQAAVATAAEPQADGTLLHVACAAGRLVTLRTSDHRVQRDVRIDADLRDVLVSPEGALRVSTFKDAELLSVEATGSGTVLARTTPGRFDLTVVDSQATSDISGPSFRARPMQPHIAWRTLQSKDGSTIMLHQASAEEQIDITKREDAAEEDGTVSTSPYGGSGGFSVGCEGVVVTGISQFGRDGKPLGTVALDRGVLNVDMAISPNESEIAIVEAGSPDDRAPRPTVVNDPESDSLSVPSLGDVPQVAFPGTHEQGIEHESKLRRVSFGGVANPAFLRPSASLPGQGLSPGSRGAASCNVSNQEMLVPGQATSVAYTATGDIVVQSREPALLAVIGAKSRVIDLGGDSVRDTGHDLFHRNSGGGIACASCHAEGAEDGHTWNFTGQGLRRTQALHVGLAGTAPFHWAGDEADLNVLMDDVFVGRMGGVHQSDERVTTLSRFLFALKPPAAMRETEDAAALRGKELFHSAEVGCVSCHSGANFSDNKSYDVGTSNGELLQVPSLRGVAYRAPFIHTGCARTLHDRFRPECGGTAHGNVAQLEPTQIDDLVAFLQTL